MADRICLHEVQVRRELTAEHQAKLEKLPYCANEQTDSGFVDDMEEEDGEQIEDEADSGEQKREDDAINKLSEETTRLNLKSLGESSDATASTTTSSKEQRQYHEQVQQYVEKVRNAVRNRESNENGDTLLHIAIIHRKEVPGGLAELVIKFAPDSVYLDTYNNLHQTPLHLAVHTRDSKIVRALMDGGARVDIPDRLGRLPLHIACENGDVGCITEITRAMHDTLTDFAKRFPGQRAALRNTVDAVNFNGLTALQVAAVQGFKNIVQYLVDVCGADVDIGDAKSGRTALHHAVEARALDMVMHLILKCRANINATTLDECTPLHISTGLGLSGITNFLVASGADTTYENLEGDKPTL